MKSSRTHLNVYPRCFRNGCSSWRLPYLLVIFVFSHSGRGSYSETQYAGLEALYNATGGDQRWTTSGGWRNAVLGVCGGWYGVVCDSSGENVTGLSLAGNGLAGNLADAVEFFQVLSLEKVDLSDNELVGAVPAGLGLMPNLNVLDLSRNEFSSFPSSWGSGASSLQHLSLRQNNLSGTLPASWLNGVNSSASHTLVHSTQVSSWLPELRTLALGSNNITMTLYRALQSIITLPSLQMLDLSDNVLSGTLGGSFELYYCAGGSLDDCDSAELKAGASVMAVLLLASNLIEGGLEKVDTLPRSLSVLTLSDNLLHGPVAENFAQLSVFFADGNGRLNDTSLPSFASYTNSSAAVIRQGNISCPVISGRYAQGSSVRLALDSSYLDYVHCVCVEGMEGNGQGGCVPCSAGTYRGAADLFNSRSCAPCPTNAGTMITGAESASQCKCSQGYFDALAGSDGDSGPSCSACPYGGEGWDNLGATSITVCSCPVGRYLDEADEDCAECGPGTYKSSVGNDVSLCLPCAKGTYSVATAGPDTSVCTPCPAGTYSVTSGAETLSECTSCPSGTYSAATGLFASELCGKCPAGYYSEDEGATDVDVCLPCPRGTYSAEIGASSEDACEWCEDGLSSLGGSQECELLLTNSRRTLVIYLIVGASTLAGIAIAYETWHKKVHKKKTLMVDSRTDTPLKMTRAKRKAHMWAVFFHTLETLDVITGNALFVYLLEIGAIQGLLQYVYWLVVSMGLVLNVYRLYKVLWMQCMSNKVSVQEKMDKEGRPVLVVFMLGAGEGQRRDRRIMTPDDAKMVVELVKILKHLQVNKFKVQLAVVMDLPLTILNLYILWIEDSSLIQSPLFTASLILAVFSAGKISTLIEYHLELRQRKRKLERLLLLELKSSEDEQYSHGHALKSDSILHDEEDDCFEHGNPETLLKFHGQSIRNIATKEAEDFPSLPNNGKSRRYLQLSPGLISPKPGGSRKSRGGASGWGRIPSFSPRRFRRSDEAQPQENKRRQRSPGAEGKGNRGADGFAVDGDDGRAGTAAGTGVG